MKTPLPTEAVPSLEAPSDEELFLRYRDRQDPQAFETLVHKYERELYGYLCRYLHDATLAEDVFQATFAQLHRKRKLYARERRFRPWLYSIATHLAIDALRKAARERTVSLDRTLGDSEKATLTELLPIQTRTPVREIEDREFQDQVHRTVDQLPEHLRTVVGLVFFQGLKYSEVAEILGIPLGTVKSRLHAAMARLNATAMPEGQMHTSRQPRKKVGRYRLQAAAVDPPPVAMRDLLKSSVAALIPPKGLAARVCQAVRMLRG